MPLFNDAKKQSALETAQELLRDAKGDGYTLAEVRKFTPFHLYHFLRERGYTWTGFQWVFVGCSEGESHEAA